MVVVRTISVQPGVFQAFEWLESFPFVPDQSKFRRSWQLCLASSPHVFKFDTSGPCLPLELVLHCTLVQCYMNAMR
jgi:hypothetical protein